MQKTFFVWKLFPTFGVLEKVWGLLQKFTTKTKNCLPLLFTISTKDKHSQPLKWFLLMPCWAFTLAKIFCESWYESNNKDNMYTLFYYWERETNRERERERGKEMSQNIIIEDNFSHCYIIIQIIYLTPLFCSNHCFTLWISKNIGNLWWNLFHWIIDITNRIISFESMTAVYKSTLRMLFIFAIAINDCDFHLQYNILCKMIQQLLDNECP